MRGLRAHWNWSGQDTVQVVAFSNCEEVELSLNGKVVGRQSVGPERFATFAVKFEPGKLRATGIVKSQNVARAMLQTAGEPAALKIDLEQAASESGDVSLGLIAHAIVSVVDANGVLVSDYADSVNVSVSGAGRLLAVDNGDLQDTTALRSPSKRPRNGQLLAIVERAPGGKPLRINATCQGLKPAQAVTNKSLWQPR
jgi:beta-galactosidase